MICWGSGLERKERQQRVFYLQCWDEIAGSGSGGVEEEAEI